MASRFLPGRRRYPLPAAAIEWLSRPRKLLLTDHRPAPSCMSVLAVETWTPRWGNCKERGWQNGGAPFAIAAFSRAVELNPANGEHWALRGEAYQCKGNGAKALADYNQAVQSSNPEAGLFRRADFYGSRGQWTEAL